MTQIAQIIRDARRHQQSRRLNEAGKLIEQVLQLDPNNSEAIHYRGLLAQQHGDSALALKWLNRSVELAPGRPDFHNNLATVLGSVGRFEEALKHLDEALRLDPNYSAARANRKNALAALGRVPRERAFGFSNETECGGDNHCDAPVEHARAEEPIEILRDEVRLGASKCDGSPLAWQRDAALWGPRCRHRRVSHRSRVASGLAISAQQPRREFA